MNNTLGPDTLREVTSKGYLVQEDFAIIDACADAWDRHLIALRAEAICHQQHHDTESGTHSRLESADHTIKVLEAENRVLRNNTSKSVLRRLEAQGGIGCGMNKFPDDDYMPTDEGDK